MSFVMRLISINALIVVATTTILTLCNGSGHTIAAVLLGGAILAVSSAFYWIFTRKAYRALLEVTTALEQAAGGDLSLRVESAGFGEITRLGAAFNQMLGDWNRTMHKF